MDSNVGKIEVPQKNIVPSLSLVLQVKNQSIGQVKKCDLKIMLDEMLRDHQSYYNSSSGMKDIGSKFHGQPSNMCQGITKVIRLPSLGAMNACMKLNFNQSNNYLDILYWNKRFDHVNN